MAKRKSNKTTIVITSVIGIALLATLILLSTGKGDKPVDVMTSKVERRTITQTVSAVGSIEPETEVKISSQTSGEIIFLGVKEGDTVKMRQLLARINPDIVETQLEQVKASAEAANMEIEAGKSEKERAANDFNRAKELYEKKFISQQEFDASKSSYERALSSYKASLSRYEQAKATLRQYERSMFRTSISSPISGIVTSLSVELGEKVVGTEMMQGTEMMKVSDLTVMNAVVDVDENDIVLVKVGDTTLIEIDAIPNRVFKGKVFEIGHSALKSSLGSQDQVTNFSVKIRLIEPEPRLRPGMSCNVEIQTETRRNVLSVPLQAVTIREKKRDKDKDNGAPNQPMEDEEEVKIIGDKGPKSVVFVKRGDVAKMIEVETGIADRGYIEIISGLKEGDEVISGSFQAVSKLLNDGTKVSIDSLKRKPMKK